MALPQPNCNERLHICGNIRVGPACRTPEALVCGTRCARCVVCVAARSLLCSMLACRVQPGPRLVCSPVALLLLAGAGCLWALPASPTPGDNPHPAIPTGT